jgi:hypothetical protein
MLSDLRALLLATTLVFVGGSACAMKQANGSAARCSVAGAELLPSGPESSQHLCSSIERELAAGPLGPGFRVEVRVVRKDILSATVITGDGRRLPELNTSVSDGFFTPHTLDEFAKRLAAFVADHVRQ